MPLLIKIEGLDAFRGDVERGAREIQGATRWAMVNSVNAVKNTAQQMAPYKTGTLRRSIFTDIQDGGFRGVIGQDASQAPYGIYIEYGTAPHEILPINRQALFWKGALNPYKRVMHPGTAAKPFMSPAFQNNIDNVKNYFSAALEKVVLIMAGKA